MDLAEYQPLAKATALPRSLSLDYLVPMIIGEIGEMFGQKAKALRDNWAPADLEKMLISEYGDIAWGTAILLDYYDIHEVPHTYAPFKKPELHLLRVEHDLMEAYMLDDINQSPWPDEVGQELWMILAASCTAITGRDFDYVLAANVDKLARRAHLGTLQGSGDAR